MNRKANWAFFGLAFGVFVASGIILFNMAQSEPNVEYVGQTANIILDNTEKQQNSFLRIDHNVDIIAENAVKQTARKNGINGTEKCKELGYKVLDKGCEQDITQVLNENVESGLDTISSNLPHIQNLEISHQLNQDGTISYQSQSALTFTVERESTIPTNTEKQGTTPFGEPLVSLTDLPRIECEKSSCTGYEKQCAVKPNVYNQLKKLSNYLEKHGYRAEITSSTRTLEMQKFFFDMNQYCNQVKENRCSGDKDKRACRKKYRQVLRETGQIIG